MTDNHGKRVAAGGPGMEPRWTRGAKEGVGTAYSTASRVWYTISNGCLTEVYFPTIDKPQIRDLQYLVTDGETFFADERRGMDSEIECLDGSSLGYRIVNRDPKGRFTIEKKIIGDPHLNCVLINTKLTGDEKILKRLQLYALCAPHLELGGWGNNGEVMEISGRKILTANKAGTWMAMVATIPFEKCSCGYVGVNDGWTDLSDNYRMDWEYDYAPNGNLAVMGKLDLSQGHEFTLALALGSSLHIASNNLFQSLANGFDKACETFLMQWARPHKRLTSFPPHVVENTHLLETSVNLLLAHEDKKFPGALIASLSIPWGEDKGDDELGGYHLVWTRDMVNCASALMAADDTSTALRALIYLAVSQRPDGGFYQNFWIDGRPYWTGIQLDEVSFPVMLAWRLHQLKALRDFDPYHMVKGGAGFLIREGPSSPQERWEEAAGFSPSTLAASIAALVCASDFVRERGDAATAKFLEEYADFLESHVEAWTVTTQSTLVPGISRHYIRVNTPSGGSDGHNTDEDPNVGVIKIANRAPEKRKDFPAKEIVDAGFLELVRYGIRRAGDPLMEDSLKVVDKLLKVETPFGPCWKRYNHDGYGQRDDGSSFQCWGVGRPWPLLTGERGHYELAAGRPVDPYLRAMEKFAHGAGLLPEQVWDGPDLRDKRMFLGKPTGAAIPLMWAHAEYVKLLRSAVQGKVFDLIAPVADRYLTPRKRTPMEVWKPKRQVRHVAAGTRLRILGYAPFQLHWTNDGWATTNDTLSTPTSLGIEYVDIPVTRSQTAPIQFTFLWLRENRWEGQDYRVEVVAEQGRAASASISGGDRERQIG